jgi:hypothetical protein
MTDRLLAAQALLRTRRLLPMWTAPGVVLCRKIGTDPILSLADHLLGEFVGLVGARRHPPSAPGRIAGRGFILWRAA